MDVDNRGVQSGPEYPPELGSSSLAANDDVLREILSSVKTTETITCHLQGDVTGPKQMAAKNLAQSEEKVQEMVDLRKRSRKSNGSGGGSSSGSSLGRWDP